jgi:hypothetical protein
MGGLKTVVFVGSAWDVAVLAAQGTPSDGSGATEGAGPETSGTTEHAAGRRAEARAGDTTRQVGDPNRVVREGRAYTDVKTGNDVYVNGNRVVVVDPATGKQITQFVNTAANTSSRVAAGRWVPK